MSLTRIAHMYMTLSLGHTTKSYSPRKKKEIFFSSETNNSRELLSWLGHQEPLPSP